MSAAAPPETRRSIGQGIEAGQWGTAKTFVAIDLAGIVRRCRQRVAEQYRYKGDAGALIAIACASVVLEPHIQAGSLVPSALNQLHEVADNLGTTRRCGADVLETCVGVGAALFAELEEVYARREGAAA